MASQAEYEEAVRVLEECLAKQSNCDALSSIGILSLAQGTFEILNRGQLDLLPTASRDLFINYLNNLKLSLIDYRNRPDRSSLGNVQNCLEEFTNRTAGLLFLIFFHGNKDIILSKDEGVARRLFSQMASEFRSRLDRNIEESEQALLRLKGLAATQGISLHTKEFRNDARNALFTSIVCGIGAVLVFLSCVFYISFYALSYDISIASDPGISEILKQDILKYEFIFSISKRVSVILLLISAFVVLLKFLRISLNQYYMNKHRQVSLESLSKFSSSVSSGDHQFVVVLEIIRQIFRFHPTGLFSVANESSDGSITDYVHALKNLSISKKNLSE